MTLHSIFNCLEAIYLIAKQKVLKNKQNNVNLQGKNTYEKV